MKNQIFENLEMDLQLFAQKQSCRTCYDGCNGGLILALRAPQAEIIALKITAQKHKNVTFEALIPILILIFLVDWEKPLTLLTIS
jgi:hypothetical protein